MFKTKTIKIIIGLFLLEVILTSYFFYIQPLCEPCPPNIACPPCISEQQIVTFWVGLIIAILVVFYLLFNYFKKA